MGTVVARSWGCPAPAEWVAELVGGSDTSSLLPLHAASEAAQQSKEGPGWLSHANDIIIETDTSRSCHPPSTSLLSLGSAVEQIEHDYVLNLNSD